VTLPHTFVPESPGRMATVGDYAVYRGPAFTSGYTRPTLALYAGSRKTASYSTGTISGTAGSRTVTGSGTSWTANLDAGMIVQESGVIHGVVESVQTNTSLTLVGPLANTIPGATSYSADVFYTNSLAYPTGLAASSVATAGQRLLVASGNRVFFSDPGAPLTFTLDGTSNLISSYHQLPSGAQVTGLQGLGDDCLVFSTSGTWVIQNLSFDAIDDAGNVQHIVRRLNEVILWGDAGIGEWRDGAVVPATDGVYLMSAGGESTPVSDGIRPLYLSYVKAGYQPGAATVHRGHYFLPILNGATLVDVLVCRLDRGAAWTRWSGHSAGVAYAQRIGATTRSPKLLSINAQRVTELTAAWDPSSANASEADGSTHPIDIITRDLPTPGRAQGSTTQRLRVRYESTALVTPTFTVSWARGEEGASFTSLTATKGGGTSDGLDASVYQVGKKAPSIRFRIQSSSPVSTFKLRAVQAEYREHG
jgi:hypothetical protein